jgi:FkbM family methyltransferase
MKRLIKDGIIRGVGALGLKIIEKRYFPIGGSFEFDIDRLLSGEKPTCIFDIGANTGQTVSRFLKAWPGCMIHSFEPVDTTFKELKRKFGEHPNVAVNKLAMGRHPGSAKIHVGEASDCNSLVFSSDKQQTETVEVSTVDAYAFSRGINEVSILKIDAEGFDLEVLAGSENLLRRGRVQFILVESTFAPERVRCSSFVEIRKFCEECGYVLYHIYDCGRVDGISLDFFNGLFLKRLVPGS